MRKSSIRAMLSKEDIRSQSGEMEFLESILKFRIRPDCNLVHWFQTTTQELVMVLVCGLIVFGLDWFWCPWFSPSSLSPREEDNSQMFAGFSGFVPVFVLIAIISTKLVEGWFLKKLFGLKFAQNQILQKLFIVAVLFVYNLISACLAERNPVTFNGLKDAEKYSWLSTATGTLYLWLNATTKLLGPMFMVSFFRLYTDIPFAVYKFGLMSLNQNNKNCERKKIVGDYGGLQDENRNPYGINRMEAEYTNTFARGNFKNQNQKYSERYL